MRLVVVLIFAWFGLSKVSLAQSRVIHIDLRNQPPHMQNYFMFWLNSSLPWNKTATLSNQLQVRIDCAELSNSDCHMVSQFVTAQNTANINAARDGWRGLYFETRGNRGNLEFTPDRFEDFKNRVDYKKWPYRDVNSRIKNCRRRIYQGKVDGRRMSVAESWPAGSSEAREFEIAFEAKREKNTFDFYVYDHHGNLVNQSEFPAGVRPAPTVCVGCHMNRQTGQTTRFITNRQ